MAGEWIHATIGDLAGDDNGAIAIGPFGSSMKAEVYTPSGIPVVRGNNLKGRPGFSGEFVYVDEETARRFSRCEVLPGDLVFPHRGAIGEVGLATDEEPRRWLLSTSLMKLRPHPQKAHGRYLFYFFRSREGRHQLLQNASQVGTPGIGQPLASLRACEIDLPSDVSEQQAIADVLASLDDKIDQNRRTSRTLERLARAIFEDWLERNAGNASTRLVQHLIESGVLAVNDGYRAKRIELRAQGLPFARAGNLLDSGFDFTGAELLGREGIAAAREKVSEPLDAVFTSKGTVGRIAQVTTHTPRFVYAPQLCFWRVLDRGAIDPHLLYQWMHCSEFRMQIDALKGQTDMADYVSLRDQRNMEITLPGMNEQREIASTLAALRDMIANNEAESGTLRSLRDLLLPKLLSGEIRVRDAEKCVGGAA